MNKLLNETIDKFNSAFEHIKANGGNYTATSNTEEVSFQCLDDTVLFYKEIKPYEHNYEIHFLSIFPYHETELSLQTFPFNAGGDFDHANITKHWNYSNSELNRSTLSDMEEFKRKIDEWIDYFDTFGIDGGLF